MRLWICWHPILKVLRLSNTYFQQRFKHRLHLQTSSKCGISKHPCWQNSTAWHLPFQTRNGSCIQLPILSSVGLPCPKRNRLTSEKGFTAFRDNHVPAFKNGIIPPHGPSTCRCQKANQGQRDSTLCGFKNVDAWHVVGWALQDASWGGFTLGKQEGFRKRSLYNLYSWFNIFRLLTCHTQPHNWGTLQPSSTLGS